VAASIKDALGLDANIEPGGRGEFTIWLDDVKVSEKTRNGFPSEQAILDSISRAI
jgi:hypothetical protein